MDSYFSSILGRGLGHPVCPDQDRGQGTLAGEDGRPLPFGDRATVILIPLPAARGELRTVFKYWRPLLAYTVIEIILPWFFLSTLPNSRLPSATGRRCCLRRCHSSALARRSCCVGPCDSRRSTGSVFSSGCSESRPLVGFDVAGSDLIAVAEIAVTVVGYATAPIIVSKWLSDVPGIGLAGISLGITAVVYVRPAGVREWHLANRLAVGGP